MWVITKKSFNATLEIHIHLSIRTEAIIHKDVGDRWRFWKISDKENNILLKEQQGGKQQSFLQELGEANATEKQAGSERL